MLKVDRDSMYRKENAMLLTRDIIGFIQLVMFWPPVHGKNDAHYFARISILISINHLNENFNSS